VLNRLKSISPLFLVIVALPTLLSVIYFSLLAEDIYVSESRILVRSPSKPDISPLGAVLGGGSIAGTSQESNAVREFLQSRDALTQINDDGFVAEAYGNSDILAFDRFGGFGSDSFEKLYEYFGEKVAIEEGTSALVMRVRVEAFDPVDAQTINERLLKRSEVLVTELSKRARTDAISFSD
jgi:ABC-2 type transport system permease protein/capsular polysaccharide transport system permease protein